MSQLPDIPRLYTALAEWLACMVYVMALRRRVEGWRLALEAGALLVVLSVFLVATGSLPVVFWLPCMAGAVGIMYGLIVLCGDVGPMDGLYYCVQAFVLAEFAASLVWQLHCFFLLDGPRFWGDWLLLLLVVYSGVFFAIRFSIQRVTTNNTPLSITWPELSSAIIIGAAVFGASYLSFLSVNTPFSGRYSGEIFNIRTIMDLGGMAILYAHYLQCWQIRVRRELEAVQNVLHNHYQQYQMSQESVDMINRKYHDLKHQIMVLRAEPDSGRRAAFLDQMEEEIKAYEAQNKTGNRVLDTVLTSKSLACARQDISLTCVADGTLLDFMDVMDLSAVFGNALDNAIEYEVQIADPAKRLIHVTVSSRRDFVLLRFENYCQDSLRFREGLPVTTKKDKSNHGYGLKSIRFVAEKYGGIVTVKQEREWFVLQVLLPVRGNTQK